MIAVHIVNRSFQTHFERYFLEYYDKLLINNSLKYASHGFSGTFDSNKYFNIKYEEMKIKSLRDCLLKSTVVNFDEIFFGSGEGLNEQLIQFIAHNS